MTGGDEVVPGALPLDDTDDGAGWSLLTAIDIDGELARAPR